jgi:DivIVA domain-containing protein
LTADRIRIPSFARPPIGRPGYDKGEVDAFLNLLAEQIAADRDRAAPKPVSRRPDRYVLYAMGSMTVAPMKPAITLEVGPDTVRLLDAERGVALAVAPLDEVTATPAHHGGIPVVVLDGAELPTLTIRPRHGAGAWQGRTKSRRPRYLVTDAEFTALIPTVGLASRLRDHAEPHGIWEHIAAFIEEWGGSVDITWRTPAMLGTLALITAAVVPASLPMSLIGGIVLLLFSAAAWRFDWRF